MAEPEGKIRFGDILIDARANSIISSKDTTANERIGHAGELGNKENPIHRIIKDRLDSKNTTGK